MINSVEVTYHTSIFGKKFQYFHHPNHPSHYHNCQFHKNMTYRQQTIRQPQWGTLRKTKNKQINQNTSNNPHDDLTFEESARIIKSHVIKGVEKAKKNNIPDQIIDFIRTHHGTVRLQYFYQSFLKNYPEQVPDEDLFRYKGPLPFSRETAVLMISDSVEAASRSLIQTDAKSISDLVDYIIDNQMEQKQFDNSPITMKDLSELRKLYKKMLLSIYHVRVEYPH